VAVHRIVRADIELEQFVHALGRKRYLDMHTVALEAARRRAVALIDAEAGSGLIQALGQAEPARSAADNEDMERRLSLVDRDMLI
jgi:hypothetical protein